MNAKKLFDSLEKLGRVHPEMRDDARRIEMCLTPFCKNGELDFTDWYVRNALPCGSYVQSLMTLAKNEDYSVDFKSLHLQR